MVVIGGGITGAGVALDAATRGYSVALVERDDWSCGTSSRSSKMIHGGLRYLQNFDLGLVREALLERQLMVRLAPHLVKPLPFLVPAFEGASARSPARRGAQHVRRDGERAARGAVAAPSARRPRRASEYWSPDRHRTIEGRRGGRVDARARAAQPDLRVSLLRLPDRRLAPRADGAGRGRALRRGLRERREGGRADRGGGPRRGRRLRGAGVRRALRDRRPTTSSTRPACGRTASGPRSSTPRRTCR